MEFIVCAICIAIYALYDRHLSHVEKMNGRSKIQDWFGHSVKELTETNTKTKD